MASTYSSLKIQLMATGENSGTWGTVTNTNLGTALEEAIVGSSDVTFASADVTLTLTDSNSSQSARNLRLNLTGTVGAPQNLIVPAIEKVYIINNGLTQTITVKNSSGTGIAVPAGKTMYVYNNGTNVVDAITHLTSLTVAGDVSATNVSATNLSGAGSAITGLNASAVSSGTLSNDRTTASSSNGASTIIARDASGNFTANTATLTTVTGAGSGLTSLNASNISSGTVATARLASGTADSSTYLRGDQTWATVSSGGATGVSGQVFTSSGTFTVPSGVTAVKVTLTGGGGGGSFSGNGTTGGTSSFGGYVSASGGGGGGIASGGAGGSASGADFSFSGQSGMDQSNSNSTGGACGFDGGRQSVFTDTYTYIAAQGMLGGIAGNNGANTNSASGYGNGGCSEIVGNRRSGGGSAFAIKYVTGLTAGSTITVTVGARGTSGSSSGYGTQGIVFVEW